MTFPHEKHDISFWNLTVSLRINTLFKELQCLYCHCSKINNFLTRAFLQVYNNAHTFSTAPAYACFGSLHITQFLLCVTVTLFQTSHMIRPRTDAACKPIHFIHGGAATEWTDVVNFILQNKYHDILSALTLPLYRFLLLLTLMYHTEYLSMSLYSETQIQP